MPAPTLYKNEKIRQRLSIAANPIKGSARPPSPYCQDPSVAPAPYFTVNANEPVFGAPSSTARHCTLYAPAVNPGSGTE